MTNPFAGQLAEGFLSFRTTLRQRADRGQIYSLLISQINKNEQIANLVFMSKKSPKMPCQDVDFFYYFKYNQDKSILNPYKFVSIAFRIKMMLVISSENVQKY